MAAAKIKIFKKNTIIENGRRKELEPTLFYEPWCEVGSLYGQELYSAIDARLEDTIVFEVRYCRKVKEIRQQMKKFFVQHEGLNYDIFATDSKRNDKQYVLLKANRTT